jgi:hypothetical protein
LLAFAACGPAFAPVVVHAPPGHMLSMAANERIGTEADGGGLFAGGLPDGGALWVAGDGHEQNVRIGAIVSWLDACAPVSPDPFNCSATTAMGQTTVPEHGITVRVFPDGRYEYE